VGDRWQLEIVGVLDGQPININIDGRFDGYKSLKNEKENIIMGLGSADGGERGIRTLDTLPRIRP